MAAARGRCASTILVLLSLLAGAAAARTYIVGDDAGWTKNLETSWLGGKTFYAGDVLLFKYDKARHDVSVVGGKGYQRCELPKHSAHSWVLRTGNDAVTLRRGNNYFICGQPGHCDNNMKLHINAL